MVTTQSGQLHCAADTLTQLALIVENSGMTAREFGDYLSDALTDRGEFLSPQGRFDLMQLCSSDSSAAEFAQGLRRQAAELREQLAT